MTPKPSFGSGGSFDARDRATNRVIPKVVDATDRETLQECVRLCRSPRVKHSARQRTPAIRARQALSWSHDKNGRSCGPG